MEKNNEGVEDYICVHKPLKAVKFNQISTRKGKVCDTIISFDIETSSGFMDRLTGNIEAYSYDKPYEYYTNKVKVSLCYIWQVAIEEGEKDIIYYGRCLETFMLFLHDLSELVTDKKIIWVHNLSFETAFLLNTMNNMEVFARKKRKPIYFRWKDYEFRCTYMLTRMSLAKWAESSNMKHRKKVGAFDYNIIRTPYTVLEKDHLDYDFEDVLIMNEGLREYRNRFGTLENIPITQTGIVRRQYHDIMKDNKAYHKRMDTLLPKSLADFQEMTHVFAGGLTRADRYYTNRVIKDVMSRDCTSAYPWQMIDKKYPMTPFVATEYADIYMDSDRYSYIIEVEFFGLKSQYWNTYLSMSKCTVIRGAVCDNGRVLQADYVRIKCINIDYEIIKKSYSYYKENVLQFKYAINDYLPTEFAKFILQLFSDKTKLKGVNEEGYRKSKEFINGCFGFLCTKTWTDEVSLIDKEWVVDFMTEKSFMEKIARTRRNYRKLDTSYMHGVYIPAYQRRDLWAHVYEMDEDILYMDTDSNKHINYEEHNAYFEDFNKHIRERQEFHADRLGVPIELFRPISPKGEECSLGEYAIEEVYRKFVTLGAKRYCYEDENGELHITVSGVSKSAVSQLESIYDFKDGYFFDEKHTKKMIMHHLDNQPQCVWNKGQYDEFESNYVYGICAQPTGYSLDLTKDYRELVERCRYAITNILIEEKR